MIQGAQAASFRDPGYTAADVLCSLIPANYGLSVGTRPGSHEITALLGKGGIREV
jgi:hypothetical protein